MINVTQPSWLPGLKPPFIQYNTGLPGWLVVNATPAGYSVSANANGLSAGSYSATLTIEAQPLPANITGPFEVGAVGVSIALTVGPGLVRPADVSRTVGAEDAAGTLSGTVPINVAAGPAVTWNASSNASWLSVSPSGQTGANLSYTIDANWLRNTAVNYQEYAATISLSVPGAPISPTQFLIRVTPQFPTVQGVGPRRIPAGQATQLVVSGRGFAALANLAWRVFPFRAPPLRQVHRVNDQKLLVDIQGPAAGSYAASVGNALGRVMPSESFPCVQHHAAGVCDGRHRQLPEDAAGRRRAWRAPRPEARWHAGALPAGWWRLDWRHGAGVERHQPRTDE